MSMVAICDSPDRSAASSLTVSTSTAVAIGFDSRSIDSFAVGGLGATTIDWIELTSATPWVSRGCVTRAYITGVTGMSVMLGTWIAASNTRSSTSGITAGVVRQ